MTSTAAPARWQQNELGALTGAKQVLSALISVAFQLNSPRREIPSPLSNDTVLLSVDVENVASG